MQVFDKVRVSNHAIDRFRERTRCGGGIADWRVARFISDAVNDAIYDETVAPHTVAGQFLVRMDVICCGVVAVVMHDGAFPDNIYVVTVLPEQARMVQPNPDYWRRT